MSKEEVWRLPTSSSQEAVSTVPNTANLLQAEVKSILRYVNDHRNLLLIRYNHIRSSDQVSTEISNAVVEIYIACDFGAIFGLAHCGEE